MKSTSQAGAVLVLVMIIIVLASLFWFLYSDYDAAREEANMANSRATRVAAMEQEAGLLRAEADQAQATKAALETELSTLEQESVTDQQTIHELETRVAEEAPVESIPEIVIVSPVNGETVQLSDAVELTVVAFDPSGISAINIVFDNNPSLEIPAGNETNVTIREPWPLSETGEHTAVVTAVNANNISSQATTVTITSENIRTGQHIIDEVANIIGPATSPVTHNSDLQVSVADNNQSPKIVPLILQTFDFDPAVNALDWGQYCGTSTSQHIPVTPEEKIISPAKELALVQAEIRNWQEANYQFSQQLAAAPNDDTRAALCALAAGHERWVMEEYIRRMPAEQQAALTENLTPQIGLDTTNILSAQQSFATAYGPQFFNEITQAADTTAVIDAWNNPPQATLHILNPKEYLTNNTTQSVTLPDLADYLGEEWKLVTSDVLGAFMLGQYLENFVEPSAAETAVLSWRGDQYSIYQQGDDGPVLLAHQINWNSDRDAQVFASLFERYVNGRFQGNIETEKSPENSICWSGATEETMCLFTNEAQSLIVKAPEANLAVDTLEELVEPEP